jgi:signal transduction histidine kinase
MEDFIEEVITSEQELQILKDYFLSINMTIDETATLEELKAIYNQILEYNTIKILTNDPNETVFLINDYLKSKLSVKKPQLYSGIKYSKGLYITEDGHSFIDVSEAAYYNYDLKN